MPVSLTPQDLDATALHAFGADGTKMRALLREVRQRAEERAREPVRNRHEPFLPGKTPESARATIKRQSAAIERLRRSHEELSKQVAVLQEQADRSLTALVQGLAGFNEQLRVVKVQERAIRTERLSMRTLAIRRQRQLQSVATTARIQQVTTVVSSVQTAAYGQKGSILATNNLLLAGNQLLWTFMDPLLRSLGIIDGPSPSLAIWLAPLGSLVTGHLALGNRQHVRFISGVATFGPEPLPLPVPLRDRIADNLWQEFRRRTDVPVTVVPLETTGHRFTGTVEDGVLRIEIESHDTVKPIRLAWMVDTGADVG